MPKFNITVTVPAFAIARDITADSIEDALKQAREMKLQQFIQFKPGTDWVDGRLEVAGVYTSP